MNQSQKNINLAYENITRLEGLIRKELNHVVRGHLRWLLKWHCTRSGISSPMLEDEKQSRVNYKRQRMRRHDKSQLVPAHSAGNAIRAHGA
jgi:hypothetical protein